MPVILIDSSIERDLIDPHVQVGRVNQDEEDGSGFCTPFPEERDDQAYA